MFSQTHDHVFVFSQTRFCALPSELAGKADGIRLHRAASTDSRIVLSEMWQAHRIRHKLGDNWLCVDGSKATDVDVVYCVLQSLLRAAVFL